MAENKEKAYDTAGYNGSVGRPMDSGLSDTTEKLNKELKNCNIYTEYINVRETMYANPEAALLYDSFMKKHLDYKVREINNEPMPIQDRRVMSSAYSELFLNHEIRAFLEAKKKLTELLNNVTDAVFDGIDAEL
ncbi:MAG: YlbF family regulator [Clostridiales bacterium]|jgi:cell fate (sporulation/competence/biofilm development) regulator YlbF (YheA/YmcA/DUF963 family)|nr:YlbF family regulator [Clostridiales bacterium]